MVENQKGRKLKVLRSDKGGEYTSTEFKSYLVGKDITAKNSRTTKTE